ncbi:MAG: hypothetical protein ACM3JQ_03950 [Candidatus Eiseniibacteriota bacterium]
MAFQNIENDNEPVSLAEDGQEEIMEEGQIDSNVQVLEPEAPLVEPEDEDHFEETTYMEVTKEPERTIEPEKIKKSKRKNQRKLNQDRFRNYTVNCASILLLERKPIWQSGILKNN